ncbi:MAG: MinD/ParA family ATP-binding protein [Planctomycetota bacterium]|jgi:MinD-like ATPase involved in chromosome partitioning or flagellar assembly
MAEHRIVSIHSYRGGTGKSNLTANLAACAVDMGKRVAVLDTDLQSPGVHLIFGFEHGDIRTTLVDFLWGRCGIRDTAYDLEPRLGGPSWLVPASLNAQAILRLVDEGYDVERLNAHFDELLEELDLDYLFIDTHPGLNRETMLATALSDTLVLILRPDHQDYQGTAVLTQVAGKLEIPRVLLVANKVFSSIDPDRLKEQAEAAFGYELVGQIPLSEDIARVESRDLFVRRHPDHAVTHTIRAVAERIVSA